MTKELIMHLNNHSDEHKQWTQNGKWAVCHNKLNDHEYECDTDAAKLLLKQRAMHSIKNGIATLEWLERN